MYETISKKKGNRLVNYLKESKDELRKVTWPSKEDTIRYSILVIAISVAVAIYFGVLDFVFNIGLEAFLKLK